MRIIQLLILVFLTACTSVATDFSSSAETSKQHINPKNEYDALLAKQLGADEYGMRSYVLAILTTGPKDTLITDKERRSELFAGHFSNMQRLAQAGHLLLAGPLGGEYQRRGIFILNVATIAEAKVLVETDPSIAAGIFAVEYMTYYGSAALMQMNDIHQRIQKISPE